MSKVVFVQFYYCSLVCLTGHCNVAEDNQSTYFIFLKLLKFGFWATWPWSGSVEFQTFRTQLWRPSSADLLASCSTAHWLLWKQMSPFAISAISDFRYLRLIRVEEFRSNSCHVDCGWTFRKLLVSCLWPLYIVLGRFRLSPGRIVSIPSSPMRELLEFLVART